MNYYDDEYNWERRPVRGRNTMASAAMVLGILAIALCSAFYIAFPCGALAVICAILSRDNHPMTGKSKAGMVCGIVGMVISAVLTVSAFRYVLTTEEGRSYLEYYYRMYTGDYDFDVDEALEGLFPFLSDSGENGESGSEDAGSDNGQDSREDSGSENDHSGVIGDDS
ncbi:MAG: DUF4190 domain-containing protein, partial [Clostridiales bacterium]|nr:DUF4190 domain-containing protein [Clostridiales bacterium]